MIYSGDGDCLEGYHAPRFGICHGVNITGLVFHPGSLSPEMEVPSRVRKF